MLLNEDFLLTTAWARRLYHEHAEGLPIIDYHCHLSPQEIAENKGYGNLAQAWLCDGGAGDHYKWRLVRANGTSDDVIRGENGYQAFQAFAGAIERAPGNPVYEWSHLELRRIFGIDLPIRRSTAEEIWHRANAQLATPAFRAQNLIRRSGVRALCTTDDPASDLAFHKELTHSERDRGFRVLPTFRPDALMAIESDAFLGYAAAMGEAAGVQVSDWCSLVTAAEQRVVFFHEAGCRMADHGMNTVRFRPATEKELERIVAKRLAGKPVEMPEAETYRTAITLRLMGSYRAHGWTMQVHANCLRNVSTRGLASIGADAGFDAMGDQPGIATELALLLDAAQQADSLPHAILYSLNPADLMPLATLAGAFQDGSRRPRMALGAAWWFNDTYDGMRAQLSACASQGLLGNFPGMLTDSRSFLSYPRHEYFRRVLCGLLGEWVAQGRLPEDEGYLGGIVRAVCYENARELLEDD